MKRFLAALMCTLMVLTMLAGCAQTETNNTENTSGVQAPAEDVAMQYKTVDEAEALLNDDSYVFFDVRKAADSSAATIPGALAYDMDAAKEGDFEAGVATMKPAIEGLDKNIILVCYSGKRYAQATTNVLSALGYDMSKVYTLEGGFTAWSEAGKATSAAEVAVVAPAEDVAMQYISVADAAKVLNDDSYVFFDVRKAADSSAATIPGALAYDMDAAKEGDFEAGVATMKPAIEGLDKNIILVCYSGKRYAQATTNVLSALGYDMSKVYTLEGGFTAWSEGIEDVAMQYKTVEEAAALLEDDSYVFFDVRKAADSSAATIPGALAYDMDAAKEGDFNAGIATMLEATKDLDKNIIIVCYSGKRYAQATTNALSALGYDMSKVYTLEGGFTAWSEANK